MIAVYDAAPGICPTAQCCQGHFVVQPEPLFGSQPDTAVNNILQEPRIGRIGIYSRFRNHRTTDDRDGPHGRGPWWQMIWHTPGPRVSANRPLRSDGEGDLE